MIKNRVKFQTFNVIILFSLLVSLSVVAIASFFIYLQNSYTTKTIIDEKGISILHSFEKEVLTFFYNIDNTLDQLGRLGEFEKNNSDNSSQLRKNLEFRQMTFMDGIVRLSLYLSKEQLTNNTIDTFLLIPNSFDMKNIKMDFSKSTWYNSTIRSPQNEIVITGPYKDFFTSNLIYSITKKIYDTFGNFSGIALVDMDTQDKNILFRHILNPLNSNLIVANADGDIIFANDELAQSWNVFNRYSSLIKNKIVDIKSGTVFWTNIDNTNQYFGIKYSKDFNLYFIITGSYNKDIYLPSIQKIKERSFTLIGLLFLILLAWAVILFRVGRDYISDYITFFNTISDSSFLNSSNPFDKKSIRITEIKWAKDIVLQFKSNFLKHRKEVATYYDELYSRVVFFRRYVDDLVTRFINLKDFLQSKKIGFSKLIEYNRGSLNDTSLSSHCLFKIDELMSSYNKDFENLGITLDLFKDNVKNIDRSSNDKISTLFDILSMVRDKNIVIDNDFNDVKDNIRSLENYYSIIENIVAKIRLLVINASIEVGRDNLSSKNDSFMLMVDEIKEHTDTVSEYMLFSKRDFGSIASNLVNINQSFNDKHILMKDLDDSIKALSYATKSNNSKIEQHINFGYEIIRTYNNIDNVVKMMNTYHKEIANYNSKFSDSFENMTQTIIAYDEKNQQFINTFDITFIEFKAFRDSLNNYISKLDDKNRLE